MADYLTRAGAASNVKGNKTVSFLLCVSETSSENHSLLFSTNFILTGNQHDRRYVLETRDNKRLLATASVSNHEDITEVTACYWLKANNATFSLMYTSAKSTLALSLYQNFTGLSLAVMGNSM